MERTDNNNISPSKIVIDLTKPSGSPLQFTYSLPKETAKKLLDFHTEVTEVSTINEESPLRNIMNHEIQYPLRRSFKYLKESEEKYTQLDYTPRLVHIRHYDRAILVDWMFDVVAEYKLHTDTFMAAVSIVDQYISRKLETPCSKLQLFGIAALFIASKFVEVHAPHIDEFVYICDNAYTKRETFEAEEEVLVTLKWQINMPHTKDFLRYFLYYLKCNSMVTLISQYISCLATIPHEMLDYKPSQIAASCLVLALFHENQTYWNADIERITGYSFASLEMCISKINALCCSMGEKQTTYSKLIAIKGEFLRLNRVKQADVHIAVPLTPSFFERINTPLDCT
jgi:hypothetical protein